MFLFFNMVEFFSIHKKFEEFPDMFYLVFSLLLLVQIDEKKHPFN